VPDARPRLLPVLPLRMMRCECADKSFEEVRASIEGSGLSLDEALRREGCGQMCTACLPDLTDYLRTPCAVGGPKR
jgi:NAD(P)H-nitrite reductase large subunit